MMKPESYAPLARSVDTGHCYTIRLQGCLGLHWSDWLNGMTISHPEVPAGETILSGCVADQAALHGLLIKIRDLGLPLIAVYRVAPEYASLSCPPP